MNIWILTIGSSDVQLQPQNNWTNLFRTGRSQLKPDRGFSPSKLPDSDRLRVPGRVMGVIYSQPQASLNDLAFPLIDNFISKLKAQAINIDKVILILSDQSVFSEVNPTQNHPFWQDTCTLQPILEQYLSKQLQDGSTNLSIRSVLLQARSRDEGLDNWDVVLELVQAKFATPNFELPKDATIYVSHQAGTPAISSAVQFCSLAKFGDRVKFLVSNEYNPTFPEKPLKGSSYLRGIRIQEAKALLKSHNYSGIKELLDSYLTDEKHQKTKILLEAAIQWNFAKFDEFANELQKLPDQDLAQVVKERSQYWWWTAYEAAYLAWLRLDQGNTVDAFFHSFRSIEGAFSNWGKKVFHEYIELQNDRAFLQPSVLESSQDYFKGAKFKQDIPKNSMAKLKQKLLILAEKIKNIGEKDQKPKGLLLFGEDLYILFRSQKPDYEGANLNRFWNSEDGIGEKRNKNFHQLQGLSKEDLLSDWEVNNLNEWEEQLLTYLNFIAKEDLPKEFESLKDASLMAKVHQELKEAIAHL